MRPTTAISVALLTAAGLAGPAAAGAGTAAVDRLYEAVAAFAADDAALPERAVLDRRCGADALCVASLIADAYRGEAVLYSVDHPDSDTIRLVTTEPSVGRVERRAGGHLVVALDRFGRKAAREVRDAVLGSGADRLVLDLRANRGGALERMLRVAALFAGPVGEALWLEGRAGRRAVAIPPGCCPLGLAGVTVLVGPETASSAEVLAALLRRHAGATIAGRRSFGKDYVYRAIPVHHDWRLLIPAERVVVPGETLAGGLVPDLPAPTATVR